jgi:hypothetical protein
LVLCAEHHLMMDTTAVSLLHSPTSLRDLHGATAHNLVGLLLPQHLVPVVLLHVRVEPDGGVKAASCVVTGGGARGTISTHVAMAQLIGLEAE